MEIYFTYCLFDIFEQRLHYLWGSQVPNVYNSFTRTGRGKSDTIFWEAKMIYIALSILKQLNLMTLQLSYQLVRTYFPDFDWAIRASEGCEVTIRMYSNRIELNSTFEFCNFAHKLSLKNQK
jgi:hypothetical protein